MNRTYSLREVAAALGIDEDMKEPERWLIRQIHADRIRARKLGRHWRMTETDVENALETFASTPEPSNVMEHPALGLTPASLRRRAS